MSEQIRPWYQSYDQGVPQEIDTNIYTSLPDMLSSCFRQFSTLTAYECMGSKLSYAAVDEQSRNLAAYLLSCTGLKPGDRIAIQMPNTLQYPIALFGILRAGMVVVNINPLYTEREMEHQLVDSGAKGIIIAKNFADKLEHILPKTALEVIITTGIGDMLGFPKAQLINLALKYVKKMVPDYHLPKEISFMTALHTGARNAFSPPDYRAEDIACLQYTGGTTGVSKGAVLTHANLLANCEMNYQWMRTKLRDGKELVVTALPLYHIFSMTVNCFTMLRVGAHNLLITNPKDIPAFIKTLRTHRITFMTGVNTLFKALMDAPGFSDIDFSGLHVTIAGGSALHAPVALAWKEKTGCTLMEGYGLSETSPVLTCQPFLGTTRQGSIGLPFPSVELSIMDEAYQPLPQGHEGEICTRGPQVFAGYWNRPEETNEVLNADGWFKTGDIGVMDEDGYFRIVDRKKDMILVSGFNVYPNEIEEVIAMMPEVSEVAVIGVPDERSGEAVKAFIVARKQIAEQEVRMHCKQFLTAYKVPRQVVFVDELPKSTVGKILRRLLRD